MEKEYALKVNGKAYKVKTDHNRTLLFVLRDELDLTGTKYGCGEGQCGACTVLIDGQPRRSCITRVDSVDGKEITTIESLAANGRLHPLQQAFVDEEAFQCGYCTPGMIMSGVALLNQNPNPSTEDILQNMQGNICRCGTYTRIIKAVQQAADQMKRGGK